MLREYSPRCSAVCRQVWLARNKAPIDATNILTFSLQVLGAVAQLERALIRFVTTPSRLVETLGAILLPSPLDETEGCRSFRLLPGPVFCQLLMADEINRASPRTQSALLQAMQEQRVAVAGVEHGLPRPFHGLATQNPIEQEGTYSLPEVQLDRFPAGDRCELSGGAGGGTDHAACHHWSRGPPPQQPASGSSCGVFRPDPPSAAGRVRRWSRMACVGGARWGRATASGSSAASSLATRSRAWCCGGSRPNCPA
jgi:hypothetical protein